LTPLQPPTPTDLALRRAVVRRGKLVIDVNTSPAVARTSASITSDLSLPMIAPRSRAACRAPRSAIDNPSQVIEVGSATATTPG